MTATTNDIRFKELEIELEELKTKKLREAHQFKMKELGIRKEIAKLYRPKKKFKKKEEK